MSANDEVTRYERALAALREAARVCAECGVHDPVKAYVEGAMKTAEGFAANAKRRATPIALGDAVLVNDVNAKHYEPRTYVVASVGRLLVRLRDQHGSESVYRLDDGRENDRYAHRSINIDDLVRVRRDLCRGKRP